MRYGMVIDLNRCIGCNACTIACKQEHGTQPGVFWSKTIVTETGKFPAARQVYMPLLCMHCKDAPCAAACPTGATQKLENGIVTVNQSLCIGCRACMVACPFNARSFVFEQTSYFEDKGGANAYEKAMASSHVVGTVEKCNFCVDRVEAGQEPACVLTCPADARFFGDLDDPNSQVSRLIATQGAVQLHPELGTDPSVYYLPE